MVFQPGKRVRIPSGEAGILLAEAVNGKAYVAYRTDILNQQYIVYPVRLDDGEVRYFDRDALTTED